MATNFTAVIQQHGDWWIGWIEEVPGVNSQGRTREELLDNLRDALEEALEMDRAERPSQ
jgi:predicted RNase H-like HicB family nuclease